MVLKSAIIIFFKRSLFYFFFIFFFFFFLGRSIKTVITFKLSIRIYVSSFSQLIQICSIFLFRGKHLGHKLWLWKFKLELLQTLSRHAMEAENLDPTFYYKGFFFCRFAFIPFPPRNVLLTTGITFSFPCKLLSK